MKKVLVVVLCTALFFGIPVSASESGNRHDRQGQINNVGKQDSPSEEEIATMVSAYEEKNHGVKAIEVKIRDIANKFGSRLTLFRRQSRIIDTLVIMLVGIKRKLHYSLSA